jgi:hypothetical protein
VDSGEEGHTFVWCILCNNIKIDIRWERSPVYFISTPFLSIMGSLSIPRTRKRFMIAVKGTPQRFRSGWQLVREWIAAELQQLGLVVVRINGKGDGRGKGMSSDQMLR